MRLVVEDHTHCVPFRPTLFLWTEVITSSETPVSALTLTDSQSIGALAALKMSCTAFEISGPIPSPGMSVMTFLSPVYSHNKKLVHGVLWSVIVHYTYRE